MEEFKLGDTVTLPHYPTLWERVKAWFGYEIPAYDLFEVAHAREGECSVAIIEPIKDLK